MRPDSSIGTITGRPWSRAELEVLGARTWGDVDDAGAFGERHVVPGDDAVLLDRGGHRVVRALVFQADELLASRDLVVLTLLLGQPPVPVAEPVLSVRLDRRGDVRGQRPRRRRPDDERFALALLERETDVE